MSGFFYHFNSPLLTFSTLYNQLSSDLKRKKTKKKKVCKPLSFSLMNVVLYSIPMMEDPSHVYS